MSGRALNRRQSKGQALIFTLIFVAAAGLIGLLQFNSGMLANSKTRLQNAVDAAAYSAGVLQARDHNFSAYTNRAMVANQAAVAQVVSLKSFVEDAVDTGDRMNSGLPATYRNIFPSFAIPWDPVRSGVVPIVNAVNTGLNSSGASGAGAMVKYLDVLINLYSVAQTAHHLATLVDMVAIPPEVLKKNDPEAKMSTGVFAVGNSLAKVTSWSGSTKQHKANDSSGEADRFADLVVSDRATDQFTRNRGSVPTAAWLSTVKFCPGFSITGFLFNHAGGTLLSSDKKRWLALDATQGAGFWFCLVPCPLGVCPIGSPLLELGGSGGGLAGANGAYDSTTGYKNNPGETINYGMALFKTPIPAAIRYASTGPGSTLDSSGGIQDYYRDMKTPGTTPANQSPEVNGGAFPITFEAERPASSIRTSSSFLTNSSLVKLDDKLASNNLRAAASAHAYFYRSKSNSGLTSASWARADGKAELENLFNPYWQTRLVDRTATERLASVAEQAN